MRIMKAVKNLIADTSRSMNERVFIVLTIIASGVSGVALLGDILYGENIVEILVLAITLVAVPTLTCFAVKYNKIESATRVISMGLIFVVMPAVFFFGGGAEGAGIIWIVFSYLYIGLVMAGWWRLLSLGTLTLVTILMFTLSYFFPNLIVAHSREVFYFDMMLGVIEVGIVCCTMAWFQRILFQQESDRAKEETRKVEELNRSQNRFFSSMSHEIRTPINSILGLNEIILRQEDASEEIIKDAGNIQGAGRMLLALINDILDFSKIEAGKMDIVPVNYSVASLVSEIVNMMWLRAEQKGIELKIEVDPSIPAELYGDEVRIKQILVNILNNAVKYTKEGSVTLHIEKEDASDNQVVLMFSVIDTGMGIKQDAIPYLFDAFQRVDEQKNTKIEGTGLGLSIVKQLVDLMDGRITVNSVYTQGSTFTVTLRQKVARADAVGDINITGFGSTKGSAYQTSFTAPEATILIVDDNEMNLEVEKKLIADTKINIDTARSGEEALALTMARHYDVIFMDHLMPEMDGIECLQNIRKQAGGLNNRVPVIVLTANAGSENKELYSRSGFEDYLIKPVSGRQLEEMLLSQLPQTKINRVEGAELAKLQMNTSRGYSRKIPVVVAVGSPCDIPLNVLKEYQIDTIPFIIQADDKIFYDGTEAGADEIMRYMRNGMNVDSDPPTVEEFEQFFGKELKKAHDLIYISCAPAFSAEYERAVKAAKTYGNVRVINSGAGSSAVGILAVIAYRMAYHGNTLEKIIEDIEKLKNRIHCAFITDAHYFLRRRKSTAKGFINFMETFNIRFFVKIKSGGYSIERFSASENNKSYARFLDYALPRFSHPDTDVIIVAYSDLSEEYLTLIETQLRKKYKYKNIVFQRASAVSSLRFGPGAFGLVIMPRDDLSYNLGTMLIRDEEEDYYDEEPDEETVTETVTEEAPPTSMLFDDAPSEPKWYENIDGIDPDVAIKNSGSEDALKTVLKIFYDSIEVRADEIEGYYTSEDWTNYTVKVHALKSSARLVGATELGEEAFALEMAGKENRIDFIKENHASALDKLRAYKEKLREVFEVRLPALEAPPEPEESEPEIVLAESDAAVNEEFDRFLLESVYEALKEGAENQDATMISETFGELEDYTLPMADAEKIDSLMDAFDRGAYDEMIKILGEE